MSPIQLLKVLGRLGYKSGIAFQVQDLLDALEAGSVDSHLMDLAKPVKRRTWLAPKFNFTLEDVTKGTKTNAKAYDGMKANTLNRLFAWLEHLLKGGALEATLNDVEAINLGLQNAVRVFAKVAAVCVPRCSYGLTPFLCVGAHVRGRACVCD